LIFNSFLSVLDKNKLINGQTIRNKCGRWEKANEEEVRKRAQRNNAFKLKTKSLVDTNDDKWPWA